MTERGHARLGPSAAERWFNCPASVRLSESRPQPKASFAASQGTAAHERLELALTTGRLSLDDCENLEQFDAVRFAVAAIEDERRQYAGGGKLLVEQKVRPSLRRDDIWGTSDVVIHGQTTGGGYGVTICDFKFGKTPVKADTLQIAVYLLGAVNLVGRTTFSLLRAVVIQPRIAKRSSAKNYTAGELLDVESRMHAAAQRTDDPNETPNPGRWCWFCPARTICPAANSVSGSKSEDFDGLF